MRPPNTLEKTITCSVKLDTNPDPTKPGSELGGKCNLLLGGSDLGSGCVASWASGAPAPPGETLEPHTALRKRTDLRDYGF